MKNEKRKLEDNLFETYVNINNIPLKSNIPLWSEAFARISTLLLTVNFTIYFHAKLSSL